MLESLGPRGPDALGAMRWDKGLAVTQDAAPNALLHTRLAIIDPRPEANQPMSNARGDVWLSYNGEVYDWSADRDLLTASGVQFHTRSDTEFILHAYEHWGIDFVQRLRGMFALAILDLRKHALYVVRDRLGLKPVVYSHGAQGFAFASVVRALIPWLPPDKRTLSPQGIDAYLAHRYLPAPMTIMKDVMRLPAAHHLRYDLASRELEITEYWRPEPSSEPWLATLDAAVRMRTVADRPLGVLLSSGIDSSTIACRLNAMRLPAVQTFTAAFSDPSRDESALAGRIASQLGLPNLAVPMPDSIGGGFDRLIADLDEPFADPSSVPTWYLGREVSRHVKVVLSGDGGDELFGGYKRYQKHARTGWRRGISLGWLKPAATLSSGAWPRLLDELRLDWRAAYVLRFSGFMPRERMFLQPDLVPRAHYWRMPSDDQRSPLETLLEIDRLNYLPEYILRKSDLCLMAHGVELRAPMLDHRFVASVLAMPPAQRFTRPAKKALQPALAPLGNLDVFAGKKRGFSPPIGPWLRNDLAPRIHGLAVRLDQLTSGQLERERVEHFLHAWAANRKSLDEQVFQLLVLDESLAQLTRLARAH